MGSIKAFRGKIVKIDTSFWMYSVGVLAVLFLIASIFFLISPNNTLFTASLAIAILTVIITFLLKRSIEKGSSSEKLKKGIIQIGTGSLVSGGALILIISLFIFFFGGDPAAILFGLLSIELILMGLIFSGAGKGGTIVTIIGLVGFDAIFVFFLPSKFPILSTIPLDPWLGFALLILSKVAILGFLATIGLQIFPEKTGDGGFEIASIFQMLFVFFFAAILITAIAFPIYFLVSYAGTASETTTSLIEVQNPLIQTFLTDAFLAADSTGNVLLQIAETFAPSGVESITIPTKVFRVFAGSIWSVFLGLPLEYPSGELVLPATIITIEISVLAIMMFAVFFLNRNHLINFGNMQKTSKGWIAKTYKKLEGAGYSYLELKAMNFVDVWRDWLTNSKLFGSELNEISNEINHSINNANSTNSKQTKAKLTDLVLKLQKVKTNYLKDLTNMSFATVMDFFIWTPTMVVFYLGVLIISTLIMWLQTFDALNFLTIFPPWTPLFLGLMVLCVWLWRSISLLAKRMYSVTMTMLPGTLQYVYNLLFISEEASLSGLAILTASLISLTLLSLGVVWGLSFGTLLLVLVLFVLLSAVLMLLSKKFFELAGTSFVFIFIIRAIMSTLESSGMGITLFDMTLSNSLSILLYLTVFVFWFDFLVHLFLIASFKATKNIFSLVESISLPSFGGPSEEMMLTTGKTSAKNTEKMIDKLVDDLVEKSTKRTSEMTKQTGKAYTAIKDAEGNAIILPNKIKKISDSVKEAQIQAYKVTGKNKRKGKEATYDILKTTKQVIITDKYGNTTMVPHTGPLGDLGKFIATHLKLPSFKKNRVEAIGTPSLESLTNIKDDDAFKNTFNFMETAKVGMDGHVYFNGLEKYGRINRKGDISLIDKETFDKTAINYKSDVGAILKQIRPSENTNQISNEIKKRIILEKHHPGFGSAHNLLKIDDNKFEFSNEGITNFKKRKELIYENKMKNFNFDNVFKESVPGQYIEMLTTGNTKMFLKIKNSYKKGKDEVKTFQMGDDDGSSLFSVKNPRGMDIDNFQNIMNNLSNAKINGKSINLKDTTNLKRILRGQTNQMLNIKDEQGNSIEVSLANQKFGRRGRFINRFRPGSQQILKIKSKGSELTFNSEKSFGKFVESSTHFKGLKRKLSQPKRASNTLKNAILTLKRQNKKISTSNLNELVEVVKLDQQTIEKLEKLDQEFKNDLEGFGLVARFLGDSSNIETPNKKNQKSFEKFLEKQNLSEEAKKNALPKLGDYFKNKEENLEKNKDRRDKILSNLEDKNKSKQEILREVFKEVQKSEDYSPRHDTKIRRAIEKKFKNLSDDVFNELEVGLILRDAGNGTIDPNSIENSINNILPKQKLISNLKSQKTQGDFLENQKENRTKWKKDADKIFETTSIKEGDFSSELDSTEKEDPPIFYEKTPKEKLKVTIEKGEKLLKKLKSKKTETSESISSSIDEETQQKSTEAPVEVRAEKILKEILDKKSAEKQNVVIEEKLQKEPIKLVEKKQVESLKREPTKTPDILTPPALTKDNKQKETIFPETEKGFKERDKRRKIDYQKAVKEANIENARIEENYIKDRNLAYEENKKIDAADKVWMKRKQKPTVSVDIKTNRNGLTEEFRNTLSKSSVDEIKILQEEIIRKNTQKKEGNTSGEDLTKQNIDDIIEIHAGNIKPPREKLTFFQKRKLRQDEKSKQKQIEINKHNEEVAKRAKQNRKERSEQKEGYKKRKQEDKKIESLKTEAKNKADLEFEKNQDRGRLHEIKEEIKRKISESSDPLEIQKLTIEFNAFDTKYDEIGKKFQEEKLKREENAKKQSKKTERKLQRQKIRSKLFGKRKSGNKSPHLDNLKISQKSGSSDRNKAIEKELNKFPEPLSGIPSSEPTTEPSSKKEESTPSKKKKLLEG